ncbi:Glu/Leu/Phe/Val dehydrogenase [Candidatus Uabimicrobium sp. HlEnr_7]|uniref:Glu/Leu/Phe/Val family dehydrogenase n=1 Tax=Candidatus Uabimicrobium helgolandensis TaxID=3095367 RepID=UPI00355749D8
MVDLLHSSPAEFIEFLKNNNIKRFYFIHNNNKCCTSHPQLQPIADFFNKDKRDYEEHEGIFFALFEKYDILQAAFVHRTCRGQGAGGTRFWNYETTEDFLRDGLRLSKGMTHKNALAGLWWGGGKGVIIDNPKVNKNDPKVREEIFQSYGKFITSLNGCYITAEDVGTTPTDIDNIFTNTRFVTCIPPKVGGSGNPSSATARGVLCGMEAALKFYDNSSIEGKTVVVQGMGHVGLELIGFLFEKNVGKVIASDIFPESIERAKAKFPKIETILTTKNDNSILATPCDVFAPCATGGILKPASIEKLNTKVVCGAANNQLEDAARDDKLLFSKNIYYVPDFLVNRMGIVNCSNEQYGYINSDPFFERHLDKSWDYSVYKMTLKTLKLAKENGTPPGQTAIKLATELSLEKHPIFGHRGKQIIDSLIKNTWHEKGK